VFAHMAGQGPPKFLLFSCTNAITSCRGHAADQRHSCATSPAQTMSGNCLNAVVCVCISRATFSILTRPIRFRGQILVLGLRFHRQPRRRAQGVKIYRRCMQSASSSSHLLSPMEWYLYGISIHLPQGQAGGQLNVELRQDSFCIYMA
jgi:hypothetical protein